MKFKKGDHIIRTTRSLGQFKVDKGRIIDVKIDKKSTNGYNHKYVIVWRGGYHRHTILCRDIDWLSELDPVETRNEKLENLLRFKSV